MSKIVFGRDMDEVTLTADIIDEKRQALAYNMLRYMMESGAEIIVNDKQIPLEKRQFVGCFL